MSLSNSSRTLIESDLMCILEWRNRLEVRRNMFTQQQITPDEHLNWFRRVSEDGSRHQYIYEDDGERLGYFNFTILAGGTVADWGFYLSPEAPKGTGRRMGMSAVDIGFKELGLRKICGQVLDFNIQSKKMHESLGFLLEGQLVDQFYDGNMFHTVLLFGMLNCNFNKGNE